MIDRLVTWYAELKIRLGVGMGWVGDFKYPILVATAIKVWFPTLTLKFLSVLVAVMIVCVIAWGEFDIRFLKTYQKIQQLNTEKYNPYFSNLKKDLYKRETCHNRD